MGSIPFLSVTLPFSILLSRIGKNYGRENWIGIFDGARSAAAERNNSVCKSGNGTPTSLSFLPALAALAASGHHNRPQTSQQTHEMTVPNELIGCIIGKGGSKIAEIR